MEIDELIKKINYLYKKSKDQGLTSEEKDEQKILRKKYIEAIKGNVRAQLDTIKIVPSDSHNS
ncbi:MAG: hypothetical protein K0R54_1418 [Clostridiaceae bacterium]|jgi:uncharacterized protein YnzC (UPF0291/DUF896 family)|nr:hypothetical protein [Clostridiaceae bacterium]